MSARSLTQAAVAILGVVALALGGVLLLRDRGGSAQASAAPDAGTDCDLSALPSPLSPRTVDVVLLLSFDKGVDATLDGKRVVSLPDDPLSFTAGPHVLRAECAGQKAVLELELRPFTPGAVHVACAGGKPSFFTIGVACEGCATTEAARKAAAKAGRDSPVFIASSAQEKLELHERTRAHDVLTRRWNALTERYSRVLQAVGREAPGSVASANQRLEELSQGFAQACNVKDPIAQDQSIRTAEETLRVFVHAARLARPGDCEFQKRLTDGF